MQTEEETWIDKSGFPRGPWDDEPDRAEWRERGFVCLALRQGILGHWCGYVGVPPGHPWHGNSPEEVEVHGGVTYANGCMDDPRPMRERVCHHPREGEPDALWWVGFDFNHFEDLAPGMARDMDDLAGVEWTYKDLAYVREQTNRVARQAVEVVG